jgi:hypothetical protein
MSSIATSAGIRDGDASSSPCSLMARRTASGNSRASVVSGIRLADRLVITFSKDDSIHALGPALTESKRWCASCCRTVDQPVIQNAFPCLR